MRLADKVIEHLRQNPDKKLTAREIAEWIFRTYPEECQEMKRNSRAVVVPINSDASLKQQIANQIGGHRPRIQKREPKIKTTEERPKKYYYTEASEEEEIKRAEDISATATTSDSAKIKEHDLYPLLAEFLSSELGIYSKRIDEKRAKKFGGAGSNKWLHPDLVGMENLSKEWEQEIKDCIGEYGDKKTKLWSFEVKIMINRSNVREVFFQAVSNSSWANFGYLVASKIEGAETLKELRILSSLHGIGVIRLDAENPSESQITIPAKEKAEVDWDAANRLTDANMDFKNYIKLVRQFYQTGEVRDSDWDAPPIED